MRQYVLPKLKYSFDALAPAISEVQLKIHYQKHHQNYVDKANSLSEFLNQKEGMDKQQEIAVVNDLVFNLGGHILHTLFWQNLRSFNEKNSLEGLISDKIAEQFVSYENFKMLFSDLLESVQGSGWAAIQYLPETDRLILSQISKHQEDFVPDARFLLVIDMWEHSYYLDYQNDKKSYIASIWSVIDWNAVSERLERNEKKEQKI